MQLKFDKVYFIFSIMQNYFPQMKLARFGAKEVGGKAGGGKEYFLPFMVTSLKYVVVDASCIKNGYPYNI